MADYLVSLESISCASCGVVFSLPAERLQRLRGNGESFYCPSGHMNVFRPSELDKVKKQLEEMTRFRDNARESKEYWQGEATKLVYRCIVAGCDEHRATKHAMRKHLATVHGFIQPITRALPADAGPSN
jgi:hypothetical protein